MSSTPRWYPTPTIQKSLIPQTLGVDLVFHELNLKALLLIVIVETVFGLIVGFSDAQHSRRGRTTRRRLRAEPLVRSTHCRRVRSSCVPSTVFVLLLWTSSCHFVLHQAFSFFCTSCQARRNHPCSDRPFRGDCMWQRRWGPMLLSWPCHDQ